MSKRRRFSLVLAIIVAVAGFFVINAPQAHAEMAETAASISSWPNPSGFGQDITFNVHIDAGGNPTIGGQLITVYDGDIALGTAALDGNGDAVFLDNSLAIGTHAITAVYAGDASYAGSVSPVLDQAVMQAQTIDVTRHVPPSPAAYGTAFTVIANSSSGLPVAITSSLSCTGSGTNTAAITVTKAGGTCDIRYNAAGDDAYAAAPEVVESVTAAKRNASVTPDEKRKIIGQADPDLTGTLAGFLAADGVSAAYSRRAGEAVGAYTINATLTSAANKLAAYNIVYNTANFYIEPLPNNPPAAGNVAAITGINAAQTVVLAGSDADNDPLAYAITVAPANGTLSDINGNQVVYTPGRNFIGTDTFKYKANDGKADSNEATVTVTVNSFPGAGAIEIKTGFEDGAHHYVQWNFGFTGELGNFDINSSLDSGKKRITNLPAGRVYSESLAEADNVEVALDTCQNVKVIAGATVYCQIIVKYTTGLTVEKFTWGADGTFYFTGDLGDFSITTANHFGSHMFGGLVKGRAYSVQEVPQSNWKLIGNSCQHISIPQDTIWSCRAANLYRPYSGSLRITKMAIGGNGTFNFSGPAGDFSLATVNGSASQTIGNLIPGGGYGISEADLPGWKMIANTCKNITVVSGQTANCVIINQKQ